MSRNSPENNHLCLDLSLSIGPPTPRQPSGPLLPSAQPVAHEHHQFSQLLPSRPPRPPSPPTGPPPPPPLSLSLPSVPSFHHFVHQPVTAAGDLNHLELGNSWGPSPLAGPQTPAPPPPFHFSPPAVTIPHIEPHTMLYPGDGRNFLEPGSTSGSSGHHPSRLPQTRRGTAQAALEELDPVENEIPPPYPWATTSPARVHALGYLYSLNINVISGQVQCKRCEKVYTVNYELHGKFLEVSRFIVENKEHFRDRAPSVWMNPQLPICETCKNSMKPVISEKKEEINWLFLLLGQMLGCCTLDQLRYFCLHTKQHRTGAKDRVLYLTYLALCKQLDPTGPFDR